jgi:uncharacterized protein (DUF433 family)
MSVPGEQTLAIGVRGGISVPPYQKSGAHPRPKSTLTTVLGSVTIFHTLLRLIGAVMTTDRIEINPEVMLGKPVIRGTRIPVELILRKLSEGATEADLLDAYPRLTRIDIQAALAYAADTVAHETILLQTP